MRNRLLWISLLLLPVLAQANIPPLTQDPAMAPGANSAIATMTAPPATQVFQSVDDVVTPPPPPAPAAKTKTTNTAQAQQTAMSQDLQDLQARWAQFMQSYLLAQQEGKQELALLEQKSMALQAEIEQLLTVIKTVSQQVDQLKMQSLVNQKQLNQLSARSFMQTAMGDASTFLNSYNNILLILIVFILLMSWWLLRRLHKQRAKSKAMHHAHDDEDDTKNEYDFMGSSEGIPAQLDLARAYIAMENYKAAEAVIAQVLAKGDADQQQQAKDLLAKIQP